MSVPWIDLPDEIWEIILGYLNVKSLLIASETCSKFNDVMGNSKQLMKMIKLNIYIPQSSHLSGYQEEQNNLKCHRQIKALKENLQLSGRNYQNSELSVRGSKSDDVSVLLETVVTNILMEICEILQLFSESIVDFKMYDCRIENKVFTKIIRIFTNLQTLVIEYLEMNGDDSDLSLKLPKVKHFALHASEESMIKNVLLSFDNLIQLELYGYDGQMEENYNNMLLRQNHLKVLHVNCSAIFGRNVLANTDFSLDSLSFKCQTWKNMDHAENFFKNQTQLKVISLELSENYDGQNFRYNDILKDIFNLNQNLTEISIHMLFAVEDVTFLNGICKPKVNSLTFRSGDEKSDLFAALVKMCPKVKKLSYRLDRDEYVDLVAINTLAELESLEINTKKESMQDLLVCSGSFINVSIIGNVYDSDEQDDEISLFLSKHQSIEHLFIDFLPISHELCKNIVNYLPNLRSFVFYELEVPTETLKLLFTLKNLRCLKAQTFHWMNQEANEICTSAGIEIELIKLVFDTSV